MILSGLNDLQYIIKLYKDSKNLIGSYTCEYTTNKE